MNLRMENFSPKQMLINNFHRERMRHLSLWQSNEYHDIPPSWGKFESIHSFDNNKWMAVTSKEDDVALPYCSKFQGADVSHFSYNEEDVFQMIDDTVDLRSAAESQIELGKNERGIASTKISIWKKTWLKAYNCISLCARPICSVIWRIIVWCLHTAKIWSKHLIDLIQKAGMLDAFHFLHNTDETVYIIAAARDSNLINVNPVFKHLVNTAPSFSPLSGILIMVGVAFAAFEAIYDTILVVNATDYYSEVKQLIGPITGRIQHVHSVASFVNQIQDYPKDVGSVWDSLEFLLENTKWIKVQINSPEMMNIPIRVLEIQADRTYTFSGLLIRIIFQAIGNILQFVSGQWWLVVINVFCNLYELATNFALRFIEEQLITIFQSFLKINDSLQFDEFSVGMNYLISKGKLNRGVGILNETLPEIEEATNKTFWDFIKYIGTTIRNIISSCFKAVWESICHPLETLKKFGKWVSGGLSHVYQTCKSAVDYVVAALAAVKSYFLGLFN